MCSVCGCGQDGEHLIDGKVHGHGHAHGEGKHQHGHCHDHDHGGNHHHHGDGAGEHHHHSHHAHGADRLVKVEQDILAHNNALAAENRAYLKARDIFALNLVSSPGSGKTTLLVRTLTALQASNPKTPLYVIEGDQQTSNDAQRIRASGVAAVQINTGKGCHLDAHMVGHALEDLNPHNHAIVFIENVGNLVCPAAFDLGEAHKVVILSVTEGEDKPLKYPDMFAAADIMVLNKCDLLPYLQFDVELAIANALSVNPKLTVLRTSATDDEGMADWLHWLQENHPAAA